MKYTKLTISIIVALMLTLSTLVYAQRMIPGGKKVAEGTTGTAKLNTKPGGTGVDKANIPGGTGGEPDSGIKDNAPSTEDGDENDGGDDNCCGDSSSGTGWTRGLTYEQDESLAKVKNLNGESIGNIPDLSKWILNNEKSFKWDGDSKQNIFPPYTAEWALVCTEHAYKVMSRKYVDTDSGVVTLWKTWPIGVNYNGGVKNKGDGWVFPGGMGTARPCRQEAKDTTRKLFDKYKNNTGIKIMGKDQLGAISDVAGLFRDNAVTVCGHWNLWKSWRVHSKGMFLARACPRLLSDCKAEKEFCKGKEGCVPGCTDNKGCDEGFAWSYINGRCIVIDGDLTAWWVKIKS